MFYLIIPSSTNNQINPATPKTAPRIALTPLAIQRKHNKPNHYSFINTQYVLPLTRRPSCCNQLRQPSTGQRSHLRTPLGPPSRLSPDKRHLRRCHEPLGLRNRSRSHFYCATPSHVPGLRIMYQQPAIYSQCPIRLARRSSPESRNPDNNPTGRVSTRPVRSYHSSHRDGNESERGPRAEYTQLWNAKRPDQPRERLRTRTP